MLIGEIIQRIQSLYSKGVESDDSRLTDRHIYNKMISIRSKLISQQSVKKQKVNQWNYQTIPCVELIKAPLHECPCIPPSGCTIYKTKYPLPKPLTDLDKHLIQSVTSLEGDIIYSEVGWIAKKYKSSSKYTASKPDFFIRNEHLYITHSRGPKIITVTGLFEDPIEVEEYPSACPQATTGNCDSPLDKEFPIDNDKVDTLIQLCIEELIAMFNQTTEDLTNNSRDNVVEQSK